MLKTALSIAGFDGSGGAGIQADLKTFSALGIYGIDVLTSLPIQNTQGVRKVHAIPPQAVEEQLACIFEDIKPGAIKIGMLSNAAIIEKVTEALDRFASGIPVVCDPVMIAKSGDHLLEDKAQGALCELILPRAAIVTPNRFEAEVLAKRKITSLHHIKGVAQIILDLGPDCVLLKGGHMEDLHPSRVIDFFLDKEGSHFWLAGDKVNTKNTHGTGCTLSSAIAAYLSHGLNLEEACLHAKDYLYGAILAGSKESVGQGNGPVHHFYDIWPRLQNIHGHSKKDHILHKKLKNLTLTHDTLCEL